MSLSPTQLTFLKGEKLSDGDTGCFGVSFTDNSRVLVCDEAGLYEYSSELDDKQLIKLPDGLGAACASQVGETLVVKAGKQENDQVDTYIGTKQDPICRDIGRYKIANSGGYDISVFDRYIASLCCTTEDKLLSVFTTRGTHLYDIDLSDIDYPAGTHLLPDHTVLVTEENGKLRKYPLCLNNTEPIWKYQPAYEDVSPGCLTSDDSGLISSWLIKMGNTLYRF